MTMETKIRVMIRTNIGKIICGADQAIPRRKVTLIVLFSAAFSSWCVIICSSSNVFKRVQGERSWQFRYANWKEPGRRSRARVPDFNTRKLEVVVYDAEEARQDTPDASSQNLETAPQPSLADVLREIEERSRFMNPKPSTTDWLREGRAGGMFGYDPSE